MLEARSTWVHADADIQTVMWDSSSIPSSLLLQSPASHSGQQFRFGGGNTLEPRGSELPVKLSLADTSWGSVSNIDQDGPDDRGDGQLSAVSECVYAQPTAFGTASSQAPNALLNEQLQDHCVDTHRDLREIYLSGHGAVHPLRVRLRDLLFEFLRPFA